jgi:hypothetical protein
MKYLRVGLVFLLGSCLTIQGQITEVDPESIASSLLIGQVYPSGNAYLKPFDNSKPTWPRTVLLASLFSKPPQSRVSPIEATLSKTTLGPDYIPGVEGMDDEHRPCGTVAHKKTNPALRYQSEDFFEAVLDYCDPNEGVALYQSSAVPHSVKVLAFTLEVTLTNLRSVSGTRPMSSAEKREVTRQKQEMEKADQCTTKPAFLDSALRLLEANAGDGLTIRLSFYRTPGCSGHLATVYVLDVLRGKDVIRTFQTSQTQGVL